jgi:hypothetical protein
MPKFVNGWRKMWFFLMNNTAAPLLAFTANHSIHNPIGGTGWLRRTTTSCTPCARSFNSYGRSN